MASSEKQERAGPAYICVMCDLNRDEQGDLATLLGDVQVAQVKLAESYPAVFSRAWIDHENVIASLDQLDVAAGKLRKWVDAKAAAGMA